MRIGFDCDDVLVDFMSGLCDYSNAKLNTHLSKKDVLTYTLRDYFPAKSFNGFLYEYYQSPEFAGLTPVMHAVNTVSALKSRGDFIALITSRASKYAKMPTESFLNIHFPNLFDEVVFTYSDFDSEPIDRKSSAAKRLGLEFFVDDSLSAAREMDVTGIDFRLYDQPWNQKNQNRPEYNRVYSFQNIADALILNL